MAHDERDGALHKLIDAVRDMRFERREYEAAKARLAGMLGKQEIVVEAAGVRLSAWLSEKLWLTVAVSVTAGWNREIEEAVYRSLKRSRHLTAVLVMAEWSEIRALCERQALEPGAQLN